MTAIPDFQSDQPEDNMLAENKLKGCDEIEGAEIQSL